VFSVYGLKGDVDTCAAPVAEGSDAAARALRLVSGTLTARMKVGGYVDRVGRFGNSPRFLRLSEDSATLFYSDAKPPPVKEKDWKTLAVASLKGVEEGGQQRRGQFPFAILVCLYLS